MNKRLISVLVLLLIFSMTVLGNEGKSKNEVKEVRGEDVRVFLNEEELTDISAAVIEGWLCLPLRDIAHEMGYSVEWDKAENQIRLLDEFSFIKVNIDDYTYIYDFPPEEPNYNCYIHGRENFEEFILDDDLFEPTYYKVLTTYKCEHGYKHYIYDWSMEMSFTGIPPKIHNDKVYLSLDNIREIFDCYYRWDKDNSIAYIDESHPSYDEFSSFCLMPIDAKDIIIEELEKPDGILSELDSRYFTVFDENRIAYITEDYYALGFEGWNGVIPEYISALSKITPVMCYAKNEWALGLIIVDNNEIVAKLIVDYPNNIYYLTEPLRFYDDPTTDELDVIQKIIDDSIKDFNFEALRLINYSDWDIDRIKQVLDYDIYLNHDKYINTSKLCEALNIFVHKLTVANYLDIIESWEPLVPFEQ